MFRRRRDEEGSVKGVFDGMLDGGVEGLVSGQPVRRPVRKDGETTCSSSCAPFAVNLRGGEGEDGAPSRHARQSVVSRKRAGGVLVHGKRCFAALILSLS